MVVDDGRAAAVVAAALGRNTAEEKEGGRQEGVK